MAEYKSIGGKRVKMSATEEQQFLDDRAAAQAIQDARTVHKVEKLVGPGKISMSYSEHENLSVADIAALRAEKYTVTQL